jgi:hypothetical protein
MASRLTRTNPVTVNDGLEGHQGLEIDCGDRLYLSLSVPNLVVGGQVVSFLTQHVGTPVPSPAVLDRRGQVFRRLDGIPLASKPAATRVRVHRDGCGTNTAPTTPGQPRVCTDPESSHRRE